MEINVIVIPERHEFIEDTSHHNEVYINKKLGIPQLEAHNARYAAPFWLDANPQGTNRVFHIKETYENDDCTVLVLGNSFVLPKIWDMMGNHRKFEYHNLKNFGFIEIKDGLLIQYP